MFNLAHFFSLKLACPSSSSRLTNRCTKLASSTTFLAEGTAFLGGNTAMTYTTFRCTLT